MSRRQLERRLDSAIAHVMDEADRAIARSRTATDRDDAEDAEVQAHFLEGQLSGLLMAKRLLAETPRAGRDHDA